MLTELSIRNFAIIDDVSVQFADGLTVLTGETGAGKSIIIDALQLLTGTRASSDFIRHDQEKAEISGLFTIQKEQHKTIYERASSYGVDIEDNMLVLERTITNKGNNICRINGKIVTLKILKDIGRLLVSIHSQYDTVQLMDNSTHLALLDALNETEIVEQKEQYLTYYKELIALRQEYEQLHANEQEVAHRLDLLQFQRTELEQANLKENEDFELEEERKRLHNFEKLFRALSTSVDALHGESKGIDWLNVAKTNLDTIAHLAPELTEYHEELSSVYYSLEEVSNSLRNYLEELHFDEARLNTLETRLNELNRLKKKYGPTVNDMLTYYDKITEELALIENKDSHVENMKQKMAELEQKARREAVLLHELRKQTARELEVQVQEELKDLYLENATFRVHFANEENSALHADGFDQIRFMISTNVGEPLKELSKIASGGELSRIMLAFKKIFARHDQIPTVVFDEIDTGVSGRVAQAIAEKMYQISLTTQVLCITHLPQVAAMSDEHLLIKKEAVSDRTTTNLHRLDEQKKIEEIGRMITGVTLTDTAIEHSEELLELTNQFKRSLKTGS